MLNDSFYDYYDPSVNDYPIGENTMTTLDMAATVEDSSDYGGGLPNGVTSNPGEFQHFH